MPPAPALCTILKFLFSTPNLTVQEQPGDMSVRVADSGKFTSRFEKASHFPRDVLSSQKSLIGWKV